MFFGFGEALFGFWESFLVAEQYGLFGEAGDFAHALLGLFPCVLFLGEFFFDLLEKGFEWRQRFNSVTN